MISPRIEFHRVRSYSQFYEVRSNREAIRFRALERSTYTLFDGDWFSTNWELAPFAWDAISAHCEGRASQWGGGKACVSIHADSQHAAELQRFLTQVLNNPRSWLQWDRGCRDFVPIFAPLEAAA
jgi:hypothetical protein